MENRTATDSIDCEEKAMLGTAAELHKILKHLRYEGKVSRGKNVKAAFQAAAALQRMIERHWKLQEEVIFPFLVTHIPKYETMIQFLRADHLEMIRCCSELKVFLRGFSKKNDGYPQVKSGQEAGVYFTFLLRHHIDLENKCVQQAIQDELRKEERAEVKKRAALWLKRSQSRLNTKKQRQCV